MSALPEKMNADEFLAWAEDRERRLELHHGAVVAMRRSELRTIPQRAKFFAPCGAPSNAPALPVASTSKGSE